MSKAINFIRTVANRDELVAHLDAHPDWERTASWTRNGDFLRWKLAEHIACDIYGPGSPYVVVDLPAPHMDQLLTRDVLSRMAGEVENAINAAALRLPIDTPHEVIDRFVDAYNSPDCGPNTQLILAGQVEPE
ncbi:hypothetical protein ACWDRB_47980 [Nonomuraea sp. NPDC003707]